MGGRLLCDSWDIFRRSISLNCFRKRGERVGKKLERFGKGKRRKDAGPSLARQKTPYRKKEDSLKKNFFQGLKYQEWAMLKMTKTVEISKTQTPSS